MAHHSIVLNYTPQGFLADPDNIAVEPEDTVSFQLGVGPSDGKIRVRFRDPNFFSRSEFLNGELPVRLQGAGPRHLHYDCHLFVNGVEVQQPAAPPGGGLELGGGHGKKSP